MASSGRRAPPAIRVLVADDHAVVREGVRQVLASDVGFDIVGEASNGVEAVELARALHPDVVVLDLSMPQLSGLDAAAQIRQAVPEARILVLSIHDHEEYVLQSVRAGAQGYLRKDSSPAELRTLSLALQNEHRIASLTAREKEVLIEIARGATNKDIATRFGISVRTVESHREALMKKLGLRGAASIARFAMDAGLLRTSTDS
jgi:DNA-binding NarL/FixJ family response regulator